MKSAVKILFLGSDNRLAAGLTDRLSRSGWEISSAWSADSDLELGGALAGEPDVVLVDPATCRLDLAGIAAATRAAGNEPLLIAVVSHADGPATAECFRQGAHDVWFTTHLDEAPCALEVALRQRSLRRGRQATDCALQESDRSHRQVFENHPLPMWVCGVGDDTILAVNNTAVLHYGYTREEFLQMRLGDLRTRRARAGESQDASRTAPMRLEIEFPGVDTCYHRRKDGTVFPAELFRNPIVFHNTPATLVVARDITPWENLLEEFRDLEHRHRLLVEQLPGVVYTFSVDQNGPSLQLSPQLEQLLGFAPEEWRACPDLWGRHIHPADRDRATANDEREARPGEVVRNIYRMFTRDGRTVWVLDQSVNVRHLRSGMRLSIGLMFDITEQKYHERRARLFAHVAEAVSDPVLVLPGELDPGTLPVGHANRALHELTGLTEEELCRDGLAAVLAPEESRLKLDHLRRHLQFRHSFTGPLRVRRGDGTSEERFWHISAVRDEHQEITHYVAVLQVPAGEATALAPLPCPPPAAEEPAELTALEATA